MKAKDLERLKEICDREGFTIITGDVLPKDSILVEVAKKDIWDGVEFIKSKGTGDIYKIESLTSNGQFNILNGMIGKNAGIPSTEESYVEQLKKEAYIKFGDIDKHTVFDRTNIDKDIVTGSVQLICNGLFGDEWIYKKENDSLYYYSLLIYRKGKWAKKIENSFILDSK
jgi:hypothetical protein